MKRFTFYKGMLIVLLISSCEKKGFSSQIFFEKDTLYYPTEINEIYLGEKQCLEYTKGYYQKFGLIISNFYSGNESIAHDYDKDGELDSLILLMPFYTGRPDMDDNCNIHFIKNHGKFNDKIFLICNYKNRKLAKYFVYKNIMNEMTWENSGQYIELHKDCFSINEDIGGNNKFYSKIYVNFRNNNFNIDSIYVEGNGDYQFYESYKFKLLLNQFNREIKDSLREINEK